MGHLFLKDTESCKFRDKETRDEMGSSKTQFRWQELSGKLENDENRDGLLWNKFRWFWGALMEGCPSGSHFERPRQTGTPYFTDMCIVRFVGLRLVAGVGPPEGIN